MIPPSNDGGQPTEAMEEPSPPTSNKCKNRTILAVVIFIAVIGGISSHLPSTWHDTITQAICALITVFCLCHQPWHLHNLTLLHTWDEGARIALRNDFCKNGAPKPHDRAQIAFIVILLNISCFAQYITFYFTCRYQNSTYRTHRLVGSGVVGGGSAVIALLYKAFGPLSRESSSTDGEAHQKQKEERFYFVERNELRTVERNPKWRGCVLNPGPDVCSSFFCLFCVFGWNAERLRFGNMYVQTATFVLSCFSPFFLFNLASVNLDSAAARNAMFVIGLLLSVLGLLYGGYWRIRMRKRFNLPGTRFCFGKPGLGDALLWLCCPSCSLAQEVRTADAYDVMEDCRAQANGNGVNGVPPVWENGAPSYDTRVMPPTLSKMGSVDE